MIREIVDYVDAVFNMSYKKSTFNYYGFSQCLFI